MAQVFIREVHKTYGDVEVIHGIDVDITDGEFVALVGPSGCGKSTLSLRSGGQEIVAVFRKRYDFKPGQAVFLKPITNNVHLFDAQSGNRV